MAKSSKPAPRKAAAPAPAPEKKKAAVAAEPNGTLGDQNTAQPSMRILAQYVKDLSFENPHAPGSLGAQDKQPDINIAVNVNARNLAPTDFEVELHLDCKALVEGKALFAAELLYAGVFRLENFPPNVIHPAVLIECPRLLFPFARQILADATRNGGFPPLMLDPIDFSVMYHNRLEQEQAEALTASKS